MSKSHAISVTWHPPMEAESVGLTMRACSVSARMVSDEATYPGTSLFPVR